MLKKNSCSPSVTDGNVVFAPRFLDQQCFLFDKPVRVVRRSNHFCRISAFSLLVYHIAHKSALPEVPKRKYNGEKFVKKVLHFPTYTVISKEQITGIPLSRGGSPPTFQSANALQTRKSTKRLSNSINWLLLFADKKRVYAKDTKKIFSFRLAFITLTLPSEQKHDDQFVKEHLLQPFLYWMNRYYKTNYVWKAEAQLNGNIHFHITIDTFIHWKSVRAKWNQLCAKHGYCKVFQDGTNDKGNAATQIKTVINELQCAQYIGSYMAKKNQWNPDKHGKLYKRAGNSRCNAFSHPVIDVISPADNLIFLRFISGRLWGCSENLSKIDVNLMEGFDADFWSEERFFFRENTNIQNLGKLLREREEKLHSGKSLTERSLLRVDTDSLVKKYSHLESVFIHRNLLTMKKGSLLQSRLAEEKKKRQSNTQSYFTVDSLV